MTNAERRKQSLVLFHRVERDRLGACGSTRLSAASKTKWITRLRAVDLDRVLTKIYPAARKETRCGGYLRNRLHEIREVAVQGGEATQIFFSDSRPGTGLRGADDVVRARTHFDCAENCGRGGHHQILTARLAELDHDVVAVRRLVPDPAGRNRVGSARLEALHTVTATFAGGGPGDVSGRTIRDRDLGADEAVAFAIGNKSAYRAGRDALRACSVGHARHDKKR